MDLVLSSDLGATQVTNSYWTVLFWANIGWGYDKAIEAIKDC